MFDTCTKSLANSGRLVVIGRIAARLSLSLYTHIFLQNLCCFAVFPLLQTNLILHNPYAGRDEPAIRKIVVSLRAYNRTGFTLMARHAKNLCRHDVSVFLRMEAIHEQRIAWAAPTEVCKSSWVLPTAVQSALQSTPKAIDWTLGARPPASEPRPHKICVSCPAYPIYQHC